jgi:Fungal specific transcription factor domain
MDAARGEPLLNEIVLALILGHVGQWEKNRQYLQSSSRLQAHALKLLKTRISNGRDCKSDHTLAAVMMFGMYEVST